MQAFNKLTFTAVLCGLFFFGWASMSWWRVTVIECWFDGALVETSRCGVADTLKNKPLLTLNLDANAWQSLRSFTDADKKTWQLTGWQKRLPQTVMLRFESSPARYVVALPDSSWWLVNQKGFLQSLTPEQAVQSGLPRISIGPKWLNTDYGNYQLQPALHDWLQHLTAEMPVVLTAPTQINLVDSFTVELVWPDWQLVIAPQMNLDQLADQLSQIKLLLSEKNQSLGTDYKKLDLRFKLPVLEPKNPLSQKLFPSQVLKPTASASASAAAIVAPSAKPSPRPTSSSTPSPTNAQVKQ
jgi:hypothetical protein